MRPTVLRLHLVFFLGASAAAGCGQIHAIAPKKEMELGPPPPESVIFDVDFTKGDAGAGVVTGGVFDGGWRVTSKAGQRIVFDAGHPIAAGYFEVHFTMSRAPHGAGAEKINWVGLYEDAALDQAPHGGDVFYARAGQAAYRFSRVKAFGKKFDKGEWENDIGATTDWITDDKTVQTVRLEWRAGRAIFHDAKGKLHECPKKVCGGAIPIDRLRYAFLGSDKYTGLSLEGIRFTGAKLAEYR